MAWNENSPAGTDNIKQGDDAIRQLKVDIRERLANEHVFTATGASTEGTHKPEFITAALNYLADGSVTTDKLSDSAVTTDKLLDNAVTSPKLLLTTAVGVLADDYVPLLTGGQWTTGPVMSLAAGTWLVIGNLCLDRTSSSTVYPDLIAIRGGTTNYASGAVQLPSNVQLNNTTPLITIITLAEITDISMSVYVTSVEDSYLFIRNTTNFTNLVAVRIG